MKKYEVKRIKTTGFTSFDVCYIYELYRNGAKIHEEKNKFHEYSVQDLKRDYRRTLKSFFCDEFVRLAVYDGNNYYYTFRSKNIAQEYEMMKALKKQLEKNNPYAVEMFDGKQKREYKKEYKIIRVHA